MGSNASVFLKDLDVSKPIDMATTEKIWAMYDKDNNGVLDRSEAMQFINDWCQAHGVQDVPAVTRIFFSTFDSNSDGTISKQELMGTSSRQTIAERLGMQQSESKLFENPSLLGNTGAESSDEYRARVVQILEACDPAKLATVEDLLKNFNGGSSALLTFLETSYGNHENFPRRSPTSNEVKGETAEDGSATVQDDDQLDMELEFDFHEYLKAKKLTTAEMEKMKQLSNSSKRHLLRAIPVQEGALVPGSLIETTVFMTQLSVLGKDRLVQRFIAVTRDKLRIFASNEEAAIRKPLLDMPLCAQTSVTIDDDHVMSHTLCVISRLGGDTKPQYLHFSSDAERERWETEIKGALSRLPPEHKDSIVVGHHAFELTFDMMLGIRTSVGRMESSPMESILKEESMLEKRKTMFPQKGSKETPPHRMQDFWFTDYAPNLFRKLRARYGIDPASYLLDICGNFQYLEFISNSKSGEFFFYSHNKKYMIKTVSKQECHTMMEMLPGYYRHLMSQPSTLLTKYFGLYQVKSTRTIHFLIMGNVFPPGLQMTRLYDLKGSTKGRSASEKDRQKVDCVYKDLDLLSDKRKFVMRGDMAGKLIDQIRIDVAFLREHNIIDYSMLVGVRERVKREARAPQPSPEVTPPDETPPMTPEIWKGHFDTLSEDLAELRKLPMEELTVLTEGDFLQRANGNPLAVSLFQNMKAIPSQDNEAPARNRRPSVRPVDFQFKATFPSSPPAAVPAPPMAKSPTSIFNAYQGGIQGIKGEVYHMGLIDTLIQYGVAKKMESTFKTTVLGADQKLSISVVNPVDYAARFESFLNQNIVPGFS